MNIIDIAVVFILLAFAVLGWKRGVFEELVTFVGFVLVVVLAFYLKNPVAEFLSVHLPFFKFGGYVANVASFNILFYQVISYIFVIIILEVILQAIIKGTHFLEKVLKFTVILGIPSKILGFVVGLAEGFVVVFLLLFVLKQPIFDIDVVRESKFSEKILNSTPLLSNVSGGMVSSINDTYTLITDYNNDKINENELDLRSIKVMLDHKVVTKSYVRKLVDKGKINVKGIDSLINE